MDQIYGNRDVRPLGAANGIGAPGGRTIWITGLSGAGKTTLATALMRELRESVRPVLIDGDQIRELYGNELGYDEKSRWIQIGRLQRLAKWLSHQGQFVIVAALYSHPELLAWNRQNLAGYFEVYLDIPLAEVRRRDSKGLYTAALGGQMLNVVGVDIKWLPPESPDLVFDLQAVAEPEFMARRVIAALGDIELLQCANRMSDNGGPAGERNPSQSASVSRI